MAGRVGAAQKIGRAPNRVTTLISLLYSNINTLKSIGLWLRVFEIRWKTLAKYLNGTFFYYSLINTPPAWKTDPLWSITSLYSCDAHRWEGTHEIIARHKFPVLQSFNFFTPFTALLQANTSKILEKQQCLCYRIKRKTRKQNLREKPRREAQNLWPTEPRNMKSYATKIKKMYYNYKRLEKTRHSGPTGCNYVITQFVCLI